MGINSPLHMATGDESADDNHQSSTLSVYLKNKSGVLMRICQIFARRAYNIDSLVVSHGRDSTMSRMTIDVSGDPQGISQIIKQINKLIDVVSCIEQKNDNSVIKEMVLVKIRNAEENYIEIGQALIPFEGKTVDISGDIIIVMISGKPEKVDLALKLLSRFDVIETTRTGKIAMPRS